MAAFDKPLPDGVYLNLTDAEYFGQETRGSSDWVVLHQRKEGWWWQSAYNPDRKAKDAAALVFGHALHAILLEGLPAYESRFVIKPDKAEFPGLCVSTEDCQNALTAAGFATWPKAWKKADFVAAMAENVPHVPVWDAIMAAFVESLGPPGPGQPELVTAAEDRMLRLMREVAVEDDRPENEAVRKLLNHPDHPPMAEVAVLATVDGIRRRWKFDRMYPGLDMDLKSLRGTGGRPLRYAVGDQIARYGLDVQRADYFLGREHAYRLIGEGKLYGGTPEQRRWISTWPAEAKDWDWVWLFYQKPDTSGHAPVIFPVWDDSWTQENGELVPTPLRLSGGRKLAKAIAFYRANVARFGLDRPWARIEPLHYTAAPDPSLEIVLPHWIQDDEPAEETAYQGDNANGE